jgi:hypothetical protein
LLDDIEPDTIEVDTVTEDYSFSDVGKTVSWHTDTGISSISEDIFSHLKQKQQAAAEEGALDLDHPDYEKPIDKVATKISQRIRFNLIRHRGIVSDIPTLKLFKSFAVTLKKADPSIIILPFKASKQHYSSLSTLKNIQAMEENKLSQFFKLYHQWQLYSLGGYFHISSELSLDNLKTILIIDKWLDSHRYNMKLCPSQHEEMINIGVLCYSSIFTFRDDLKQAILKHPLWSPSDPDDPPIFDIFIGELNTSSSKTKMLFVSAERSKQEEVSKIFRYIYDGTQKSYPNGSMMMFIPIDVLYKSSNEFRNKIQFNHDKYIGDETLFCIGGFQNLNNIVQLKNGKSISIHHLLKSIPATQGMSQPQLFQQAEPNPAVVITIVSFQAQDREMVMARQATLEEEIRNIIADGEENK